MTSRRLALGLVLASSVALVAMVVIALATGASQEAYEYVSDPTAYARSIVAHASGVRLIFAVDVAFLVLYTAFFAALTDYLKKLHAPLATLAFVAMAVTSLLDILENHHILALLGLAEHGVAIDPDALVTQQVLSSTKFSVSYLSLFLYGLSIPRTSRLAWAVALFLTVGTLATGILGFAALPEWRHQLDSGRWIGFLAGFLLTALWLRRAPEPAG